MNHIIKAALLAMVLALVSTSSFASVSAPEAKPMPQSLLAVMSPEAEQAIDVQPSAPIQVAGFPGGGGFNCFSFEGQYCANPGATFMCMWGPYPEPGRCVCDQSNQWVCY